MKDSRSASQILFGLLPQQTLDAKGNIWKVAEWKTVPVHNVDPTELRRALERAATPWAMAVPPTDHNFVNSLRQGRDVRVESLDRAGGVRVHAFPQWFRCKTKTCNRLHRKQREKCECGSKGPHGQLPFVLFHDACGEIKEPHYRSCTTCNDAAMFLPGTTNLGEIRLYCPKCKRDLGNNFLHVKCQCGLRGNRGDRPENMEFAVHRSAAVYTPRTIVIVNPPSKQQMRDLIQAGGGATSLSWIADGMEATWIDKVEGAKAAALRRELLDRGLDPETVELMMAASKLGGGSKAPITAPESVLDDARHEAASIALAMSKTRQTLGDLVANSSGALKTKYLTQYPKALKDAGIQRIDLIERFPILTGQFGYTRGDHEPGSARLRTFTEKDGTFIVYGDVSETEALFVRLQPPRVLDWLIERGHSLKGSPDPRTAYSTILQAIDHSEIFKDVVTLVHSLSHRMVRHASFYAGIDRNALSELLFPRTLSFVTYAVPRGDFVLGGLQAMYSHDLDQLLQKVVFDESRCALDPGCSTNPDGAACAVCLHLGEPSCRMFNTQLDRKVLFDRTHGYFAFKPAT
jgi:hypothetical protein